MSVVLRPCINANTPVNPFAPVNVKIIILASLLPPPGSFQFIFQLGGHFQRRAAQDEACDPK